MPKRLQNNPLLMNSNTPSVQDATFDLEKERAALGIEPTEERRGRSRNEKLIRGGVQDGLPEEWTRASFIIRVETLERLKDMAYTDRIKIKDALDMILNDYLEKRTDLLKHK